MGNKPTYALAIEISVLNSSGFLKELNGAIKESKLCQEKGCCKAFSRVMPAPLLK